MAGYAQNPLVKKLGIKPGYRLYLENTPDNYSDLIQDWPEDIVVVTEQNEGELDFIHFFTQEMAELEHKFPKLKQRLKKGGGIWISWPKGTSKIPKDLNGNDVRNVGLDSGLVDVKVCAVDEDWSAIKFMFRTQSNRK